MKETRIQLLFSVRMHGKTARIIRENLSKENLGEVQPRVWHELTATEWIGEGIYGKRKILRAFFTKS